VWLAAYEVYPGKRFWDYAILGDDIVIADAQVAREYSKIMDKAMGVISREKSLVSYSGCCEFAKRFIINNHRPDRKDVSPLSVPLIKSLTGFSAAFVFSTLGCSLVNSFRLKGGGYRVYSRIREDSRNVSIFQSLSRRWRRHWVSMFSPSGIHPLPFELWLAFPEKGILSCYEKGVVRSFILERVEPRDIDEKSIEQVRAFWDNDPDDMFERHLQSFVVLHLEYVRWYAGVILDYDLPLAELLNPPISPRRIERVSDENEVKRYGLAFKAWDHLRQLGKPVGILGTLSGRIREVINLSLFRSNEVIRLGP